MRRFLPVLVLVLLAVSVFQPERTRAISATVVISQVYGGGGNAGATLKNDFIEIFNRGGSTVSLAGWSVQYASTAGSTWSSTPLSGSVAPGQYFLVRESAGAGGSIDLPTPDASGSIAMAAGAGKVALVNSATLLTGACPAGATIVDFVGYGTGTNCFEGAGPTATLANTTAALRGLNGCTETDSNAGDFAVGAPNPRNSTSPLSPCDGPTNPAGSGSASPATVSVGDVPLLMVAVTPGANPPSAGVAVSVNLAPIGGSATQAFFDDGSNGDATAGDNVFSFQAAVAAGTSTGDKSLPFTISDSIARSGSGAIALHVVAAPLALAIHDIQGPGAVSAYAGQLVRTEGIVTARRFNNGFFIQSPDAEADADPNTSEGIFVFTSSAAPAAAAVGNRVQVTATVAEFVADAGSLPATELASPSVILLSTGEAMPSAIALTAGDTDPAGPLDQLERFEGMRVHVEALTVVAPTQGSVNEPNATATTNGIYYGVLAGIARPFREAGIERPLPLPPLSPCCVARFDGNPEKIRVDSNGQAVFGPNETTEVMSGAVVSGITGVLDYGGHAYTILPDFGAQGIASALHGYTAVAAAGPHRFTVATANLERFFDTINDPSTSDAVLTPAAYANRLAKVALQVRDVMRAPDIIGVEEVESQAVLQDIANAVNTSTAGATQYAAYLFEGNDPGGIDDGFLVNLNRVAVRDVHQDGKSATYINPKTGLPELLNDRPPTVLRATVLASGDAPLDVTVIANHLRSLNGVDDDTPVTGDGPRVRAKRLKQAEYLGHLIESLQLASAAEPIVAVGDFNAFEVSDGYVDVIGTISGTPVPADQVVLASADVPNASAPLVDLIESDHTPQRYSYSFDGNAQSLDHVLASQSAQQIFDRIEWGHSNADFPETLRFDASRPERLSDHDPVVAYFVLAASTTTTVSAAANPADVAGDITFVAHVAALDGPATTGSVHFSDGAGFSATAPVVNGQASVVTAAGPFGIGLHAINASFSDGAQFAPSAGSGSFAVADLTPPPAPVVTVTPSVLAPPNHKMVAVSVAARSIDAVSGAAVCSIAGVTSNEPDNGLGDGDTANDAAITGALTLNLRAERSGTGQGRVYAIRVSCVDAAGNAGAATTATVSVPKGK